jgi:beta-xylosidase
MNDAIYFMASHAAPLTIYKTTDPRSGKWQIANPAFPIGMIDPDLFVDDDGRLFFYYGCSNINPIYGVELDTKTLNPIGNPIALFNSKRNIYGWERKGDYNNKGENPWIEGSWMTKRNDKYYLQYAGPGTEFKSYSDGVYISDKPLGPFTLATHNPASYKTGRICCWCRAWEYFPG